MSKTQNSSLFNANDLFPSLREALAANNMNAGKLTVALPGTEQGRVLEIPERQNILLHDGEKTGHWKAPLLRELFRGDKKPPPNMSRYPEEYVPFFWFIERHLLTASAAEGGLRDRELEEIYSSLRRRPDGKSLGRVHAFIWQVAAVALALRSFSQAEYEEVVGQLARSCGHFAISPSSRNYIQYLQSM